MSGTLVQYSLRTGSIEDWICDSIDSKGVKTSLGNIISSNIIKMLFARLFYFLVNEINKEKGLYMFSVESIYCF